MIFFRRLLDIICWIYWFALFFLIVLTSPLSAPLLYLIGGRDLLFQLGNFWIKLHEKLSP